MSRLRYATFAVAATFCVGWFAPVTAAPPEREIQPKGGLSRPETSRLLVPVQGVRPEELTDTYTEARSEKRKHDAIDIAAPRGTPVLAATNGTILKLFQSKRGGVTLYLLAQNKKTILYYAHLDRYAVGLTEGQPVQRGAIIAFVGNTGNAGVGNYHLHFEVTTSDDPKRFWAGVPQNPYPLLTGKPGLVVPVPIKKKPTLPVAPNKALHKKRSRLPQVTRRVPTESGKKKRQGLLKMRKKARTFSAVKKFQGTDSERVRNRDRRSSRGGKNAA